MNKKIPANDLISQGNEGKEPAGIHPVVQQRLESQNNNFILENEENTQQTVSPQVDYVTREEMRRFVADLNVQLNEISKWLNQVVTDNTTFKNTFMTLQTQISNMQTKYNQLARNL